MHRLITLSLVLLIGLYNTSLQAQKTFTLNPNESKSLTNTAPWTLNATCTVQVSDKSKSKIKVNVVKNTCTVNGRNLAQGQAASMTIHNNTSISVSADAGTEINLENTGTVELKAACSS